MSRFAVTPLLLPGLQLVERQVIGDSRGFLSRLFCAQELSAVGWLKPIAQINQTCTVKKGTVRGMHYQSSPACEMKLVSCIRGMVWDVAIDLRKNSPSFLTWHAEVLSENNRRALLIPEGFAHGFQAMTNDVELLYCHSAAYSPAHEQGLNPLDPQLDIRWPLDITEISVRDAQHPLLDSLFSGIDL